MTHTNNQNKKQKISKHITQLISCFVIITLLFAVLMPGVAALRGNQTWAITLQMNESGGAFDTAILSEAFDARDGPPHDSYDIPKPIPPMPPYIRTWLNDNLAQPYHQLWEDCRKYPDTSKTWNLSMQWFPQDYVSPTTLTITWNPTAFNNAEYNIIHLYHSGSYVADMLTQSSYTYTAPALAPVSFTIQCSTVGNQNPIAVMDTASTTENNPVAINVTANDYDNDGTLDLTSVSIETPPQHGTPTVNPVTGIITYSPTPGYSGNDSFTYTIRDNVGAQSNIAEVHISINYINQPPTVSNIPDQIIPEGSSFSQINLDSYVSDLEDPDANIQWTTTGSTQLTISITNRIATISIPNPEWSGAETITFIAEDTGGLIDSDAATFTVTPVNDPPQISDIPSQTISEGQSFTSISLDDYVLDVDNPDNQLIWSYSGNTELSITIDSSHIATITIPSENWNGAETIIFTVSDPSSLSDTDSATFTVTAINDPPSVSNIPNQNILEGASFTQILLDNYVTDIDDPDTAITWSHSGAINLQITITNRIATISAPFDDWFGTETVVFTATDIGGLSDSDSTTFTINPVNDPPVVSNIPDQTIADGQTFAQIILDNYVDDVDNPDASITWSHTGSTNLQITILNRIATITAPTGWIGQETITFTATDPENLSDTDTATFAITIGNYPPQVDDIPDQTINEGQQFTTINLNNYVTDVEDPDANIQWTTTGTFDLIITISPAKIATITIPHTNWAGSELITFIATDTGSLTDSDQALFTVNLVNDPPQVLDIPAQTISEGGTFTQIQLDSYVTDIDNLPSEITWTATGQTDLLITILPTRIAIIEPPNTTWNGAETITFTATDPGSLSDSDSATFTVIAGNDPPIVDDIPDQSINEGQTFSQINLDNYVTDEEDSDENITWTYTGNSYLQVTITNRIATITSPNPEWNGLEAITFIATDTAQLSDSDIALFEILPQNDPPIANDDTYNVNENSHNNLLHPLTNDTDIDGDTLRIISITQPSQGNATHDDTTITYTPPSNYTGTTTLTYTITDDNGSTDTATITIIIQTNDPPNTPTTPTGPTSGYTSQTYSFTTSSIDPEAHSITYGWDFNNDDIIDTWTPAYPSGDQATITTSWQAIGTYQIKVKARDTLSKESPWSTTHTITITKKTSSGGGGGGPLPPANLPPIADASAGAPYHTTINTPILLNASESYDQDGTITTWTWTIGDITKQGITTIHTFINEGSYTIKLTVIDNGGSSNSDSFNIDIIKPNSPPIITSIKAPTQLPKDTEGQITLHATDDNNDLIEYIINWGDTTTETSPYTPTSTNITLTHSWNTPGIYHITIIAHDNHNPQENHTSEPITKIIMIDAWDLSHHINGYLIDTNSDGIYDIYFNNDLDQQTAIARELNGTYRINIDGDNSWDYWYDINIDTLQPYNVVILQTETFPLAIIILLGLFLILLFVLILGQLKKQKTQKTAKKKNPPKKTSNSKKTKSTATKKSKTTKKK